MIKENALGTELNEKIALKSINHRNRFARLFLLRYLEMLPSLIKYKGGENTSIDFLKLEIGLISNYQVVIAEDKLKNWRICGFIKNNLFNEKNDFFKNYRNSPLTHENIQFIERRSHFPKQMKEITFKDNCKDGNFIVVRNKTLTYVSDEEIINHYTIQLAEIINSRFSLTLQSKVMTFFKGNIGDETVNQVVEELYNGSPYSKVSKFFDPDDQIITINNGNISSNLSELKREYQNVISELNSMLGISSLGVDKESGVSEVEAESSNGYISAMANIKLTSRDDAFLKLQKHTKDKIDIKAIYNNQVASELQKLEFIKEVID